MTAVSILDHSQFVEQAFEEEDVLTCVDKRIRSLHQVAMSAWKRMNIECEFPLEIKISNKITDSPSVCLKDKKIIMIVPFIFLLDSLDIIAHTLLFNKFSKKLSATVISENEFSFLGGFFDFMKDMEMSRKAKNFVIHHELAHILNKDIFSNTKMSNEHKKEREKLADLTAAYYSGCADGAIYLFELMSRIEPGEQVDHPRYEERVKYLTEYLSSN